MERSRYAGLAFLFLVLGSAGCGRHAPPAAAAESPAPTPSGVASQSTAQAQVAIAGGFRFPEKEHGKGRLKYTQQGVPVLIVEGTPEEIGEQVAVLGAKPADRILNYPRELMERFNVNWGWSVIVRAGQRMLTQFPEDYRKELEAMAKAGIDREKLIVGNTVFDLKKSLACSAIQVLPEKSKNGRLLFGRNLDYPSLGYAQDYSLVTVYRPKGKHAFVSIGFPGLVGCLSGMNDAGLALGVLEIYAVKDGIEKFNGKGTPYALCYRRLLEECTTVAEAEKLLRSMKRTTTTCLAICDKERAVVFEITPTELAVREPVEGLCCCTNHFCTKELKPEEPEARFRSLDRLDALLKASKLPKVGIADVHQSLHAASNQWNTMHTMVFEPAALRLHLAIGKVPASAGELKVLELEPLFKR
jgi:predicted choloylglycine hydrolase